MFNPVDPTNDIAEFLTSRRERITPEEVGLPSWGPRRVKGLRREEVASLAGVNLEYYKRLERGNAAVSRTACSRRSHGRCNSTRPSARTSSTSPAPPAQPFRRRRAPPPTNRNSDADHPQLDRHRQRPGRLVL